MKQLQIFLIFSLFLFADVNNTKAIKVNKDINSTKKSNTTKKTQSKIEQNIKKEMEKEKKYKKEQKFYQGDDYNLSEHEIDPSSLDKIKAIEPEYDFEMLEF